MRPSIKHMSRCNRGLLLAKDAIWKQEIARSSCVAAAEKAHMEARQMAAKHGYNTIEQLFTTGGDDRNLILAESGTNKYHCKPQPIEENMIFRGSCTCNFPTQRGYDKAQKLYTSRLEVLEGPDLEKEVAKVFAEQRARISQCLELPDGCEIIICPSGSDSEYLPIAIARALQPATQNGQKIVNVVTQLREVGAGSAPASGGQWFSSHAPLLGKVRKDDGTHLEGFCETKIDTVTIPARKEDGEPIDASAQAATIAENATAQGAYPIVHGVFGGKTGLRDRTMPGSSAIGTKSLGVVDACQGRFSLKELHSWIKKDSIVLFTASKFFQAPPFCGAVIIPPRIAERLRVAGAPGPESMFDERGLGAFLTAKELPDCLNSWAPMLNNEYSNIGLALRWEAGLAGMEHLATTPDEERVAAVKVWSSEVSDMVDRQPELDAWCVERSIVSVRLRSNSGDSAWLSFDQLKDVYHWMSLDLSDAVKDLLDADQTVMATRISVGQPVDVAESHGILRIALGADSLASITQGSKVAILAEDQTVVRKLALLSKHFPELSRARLG